MKTKITRRLLETVAIPAKNNLLIWDDQLPGFFVKVTPTGKRIFGVYYRTPEGIQRRPMLGQYSMALDIPEARKRAAEMLREASAGRDPSAARQAAREAITMNELCDRYMSDYAQHHKKASTLRNDRSVIKCHIKPNFGNRHVTAITRADIAVFHARHGHQKTMANRTLALLSHMFNMAETWGLRPEMTNPVRRIPRYRENRRERFLSIEELKRLADILRSEEQHQTTATRTLDAIWLLMFTGCRMSEILTLRWNEIDFATALLRKAESKTGKMTVALNKPALERLESIYKRAPRDPEWVIPGDRLGMPLVNLEKPWRRIRAVARLDGVRIHDLRHTYASLGVSTGISLPLIGALLNHRQPSTTARYAHAAPDPVRRAAEAIGNLLGDI